MLHGGSETQGKLHVLVLPSVRLDDSRHLFTSPFLCLLGEVSTLQICSSISEQTQGCPYLRHSQKGDGTVSF